MRGIGIYLYTKLYKMNILYNLGELLKKAPLNYKAPRGTK